jgi:hypothetical protein
MRRREPMQVIADGPKEAAALERTAEMRETLHQHGETCLACIHGVDCETADRLILALNRLSRAYAERFA